MVFPTLDFVLFFAVVLALNGLVWRSAPWRKAMLIAASYTFYAAWDIRFCGLMAGVSAVAWLGGLNRSPIARAVSIAALIATLGVFKYFNFFMLTFAQLFSSLGLERDLQWASIILPVGISFYIFQAVSYVMDAHRGHIEPRRNPTDVFLYISFFPQLVAGPIVRAAHFLPQIDKPTAPDANARALAVALILMGLFKKMVVANYISVLLVDPAFALPDGQNTLTAIAATLGYAVQIYCDFSGYSDIAIGVALLLGYRFVRNFNQPYRADSLRNFWQRWHISLSTWIRDYLYIPLGGNRGGPRRQNVTVIVTMTLAGLWHGAGWNFLIWGFLHGAGIAAERGMRGAGIRLPRALAVLAVFTFVCLLWIPFRAADFAETTDFFTALVSFDGFAPVELSATVWGLIGIGLAMNWLPLSLLSTAEIALARLPASLQAAVLAVGIWLMFAAAQEGVAPFIYFQF
ncbi:MAG: MBOAT family protein [Rhodobacteraceae bacterium]|nr:MBOAT family protein [Paracoccaceae bacterium]